MMLPYLKPKRMNGMVLATVKAKGDIESKMEEDMDEMNMGHMAAAEEIMSAIAKKDAHELVEALRAFIHMIDAEPHVEGEHE